MAAIINLAATCSECCTCPVPTVQWDSVTLTGSIATVTAPDFADGGGGLCYECDPSLEADFDEVFVEGTGENFIGFYRTFSVSYSHGYGSISNSGGGGASYEFGLHVTGGSSPALTESSSLTITAGADAECADLLPYDVPDFDLSWYGVPNSGDNCGLRLYRLVYNADDFCQVDTDAEGGIGCPSWEIETIEGEKVVTVTWPVPDEEDGSIVTVLTDFWTQETFIDAVNGLTYTFDDDFNDPAGSLYFVDLGLVYPTGNFISRKGRYRFNAGRSMRADECYRITWTERVTDAIEGHPIDSVDLIYGGVYRPAVTAPDPGGTVARRAYFAAVMNSAGGVAAVNILNPGYYLPAVTFAAPPGAGRRATGRATMNSAGQITGIVITDAGDGYPSGRAVAISFSAISGATPATASGFRGGTGPGGVTSTLVSDGGDYRPEITVDFGFAGDTSTGWVVTMATDGTVASVSGGTAGNYMPTVTISPPEGAGANATVSFDMDAQGGITNLTLLTTGGGFGSGIEAGSGLASIGITYSTSLHSPAKIHVHFGDETAMCEKKPVGVAAQYFPRNEPYYYETPEPEMLSSRMMIDHVRAYCDCTECPE